jgi:uncharacterized protein
VHALTLAAVGVWCFLVALVGGLLGLVLGNIRLPLFLLVGTNPAAAAGANIAVSGVAAATAASVHVRARRFHRRLVLWMLPPSVVGAVGGSIASDYLPADARAAVVSGAVIGALGGLIGLILGTLRLPALIRLVGEEPARAVGTNLLVGVAVGAAGLLGHLPGGVDWTLLAVGAATSAPGALIGARYTGRLSPAMLLRAIGAILVVSGTLTIARGLWAEAGSGARQPPSAEPGTNSPRRASAFGGARHQSVSSPGHRLRRSRARVSPQGR